ncbi:hypothetical protein DL95DRAFT_418527 [Leptodontidium sp. 2 PMI_412]|nr:hypothetical protein DL95DRAFT_418527 [Leptodontidium sp. 2 PMI_412]
MEQFGNVIEVFVNVNNILAFVWGPIKLLLLTAATFSDSFDALLDAYQEISENLPILEGYQSIFAKNERMQVVLECVWSNILDFHIRALRIFDQSSTNSTFNNEFEQAREQRSAQRKAYIINWIGAPKTILDHESLCQVRQEFYDATKRPTALWILENEDVKAWLSRPVPKSSTIWMYAVPGAAEIKEKNLAPVAFCYCKHKDPDKSTFVSILKALLSQLVIQQEQLLPFYSEQEKSSGEITLHSAKLSKKLLRCILQNMPSAYLIIDGLDECDQNERRLTLEFFNDLINLCDNTKAGKIRLLIASRDEPDIRKSLSLATLVRIGDRDTFQDIKSYIIHRAELVEQKFRQFGLSKRDREYIEQYVLDKSDGMFLYAKLVMMNLEGQPCLADLREELYRLPKGLSEAYGRTMDRIERNPRANEREVARKILSWMVCSRRPLRWRELQAAISIDTLHQIIDPNKRSATHVRDICGSLVEVISGDRVDFVHATARLHLFNSGYIPLPTAELSMSVLCLNYLTFDCFEEHADDGQLTQLGKDGYFAFQDYAIAHWADHLLAWIHSLSDPAKIKPDVEKEASDTFLVFGDRFSADLRASSINEQPILGCDKLQHLTCFPVIVDLWRHTKSVLEDLERLAASGTSEADLLRSLYGENWFKCSRISCFYFHEGFQSRSSRQAHYDRHDRPFRCEEEDCPAGAIGFASLKELEKHKRNMHPGIDKLSSTFARLKKGSAAEALLQKYPCPHCPSRFASRLDSSKKETAYQSALEARAR